MTLRRLVGVLALALLVLLVIPFAVKAIDLTTDMGGFSAGQITGLRDTFVDQNNAETVGGAKTFNANMALDDGTTDSPSLTFQDATNETAVFLKVDGANTTLTIVAGDDFEIVTGNLKVGNASPGVTQDGEDFFVEGTSEFDGAVQMDGAVTIAGGLIEVGVVKVFNIADQGSTGTDWVVDPLTATGVMATLAASLTAETMIIPISGLTVGDTIKAFTIHAQIESGGNTVTIDADLRNIDNTAADPVDASVGAITQVSVTADTAVATAKTGLSHVVLATDSYYILITATTGATTDIQMINSNVTVTEG